MMIMYVGFPAIVGLVLILALTICFRNLPTRNIRVSFSYFLSWIQLGIAGLSVGLTTHNSISGVACLTGHFGYQVFIVLGLIDAVNLISWFARQNKAGSFWKPVCPLAFVLLRLLVHAVLTLSLWWCSMMCTV
jgi:hypothetical protein